MIKGSIDLEDIVIQNVCAPNSRTAKTCEAKTDIMERRNRSPVIIDFSTPLSTMNRPRQKTSK